ncbi:MAG: DUF4126 domain-containing protein [Rhodospirillales bacterium]|nr:MAG: DUF4126 domain-containing protein [Rhodospirillales bacterium]
MESLSTLALTLGAGWASGLNLYAAVLTLGVAGLTGAVALPPDLHALQSPWVIGVAALMYAINFFADKIPAVDSLNDFVHTFLRIPAGAVLAAGAVGHADPVMMVVAGLVGGTLAAGTHATKTGTRIVANASPEPFSNIALSFAEDIAVFGGLWLALKHAAIFLGLLAVVIVIMLWLLPKMVRLVFGLFRRVTGRAKAA